MDYFGRGVVMVIGFQNLGNGDEDIEVPRKGTLKTREGKKPGGEK